MNQENLQSVLNAPMKPNDAEASTIGEYLCNLLLALWEEGERFSGKRPFGNSGWEHDIKIALAENDLIGSVIDPYDNTVVDWDDVEAYKVIQDTIKLVFNKG